MTTGYTSYINDGKITNGADFLKLCTRNFGVAIELKDEDLSVPTPIHFEPDPYYKEQYEKAVKKRNKYRKMTLDEAREEFIDQSIENINSTKSHLKNLIGENDKYRAIKNEIMQWIPPTSDHEKLKEYAINQLDISMNSADTIKYYKEESDKMIDDNEKAVTEYLDRKREMTEGNVIRSYKKWQENIKETEKKNLWMKQFLDSLEMIQDETRV